MKAAPVLILAASVQAMTSFETAKANLRKLSDSHPGRGRASVFMSNRTGMTDERILVKIERGTGL